MSALKLTKVTTLWQRKDLNRKWHKLNLIFKENYTEGSRYGIFVSGKITGLEERDWRKKFSEGVYKLMRQHGYKIKDIIDPSRLKEVLPELDYEQYMRIDLTLLDMCDTIYMLDNYKDSRGAQRELAYAIEQNKKIIWE